MRISSPTAAADFASLMRHWCERDALPHGLCIFVAEGDLLFTNSQFFRLCDIDEKANRATHIRDLLQSVENLPLRSAMTQLIETPLGFGEPSPPLQATENAFVTLACERNPSGHYTLLVEEVANPTADVLAVCPTEIDDLTGLFNRKGFRAAAQLKLQDLDVEGAFLFIDLDRFKAINDTLGHAMGDRVLQVVADRIRAAISEHDIAARLSGDEFAVLYVGGNRPTTAQKVARRICQTLAEPLRVDGQTVYVGASVGIAVYPFDGVAFDELLTYSDLAMYAVKSEEKGNYRFFEPRLAKQATERRLMEVELRKAIEGNQLELYYQPLMDLSRGKLVGFEALVRWRSPTRGLVPPADFIPTAEQSGLILPLGDWVLGEACKEAQQWHDDLIVAVNVSALQLRNRNFFTTVKSIIDVSGIDPRRLELEITESALMSDNVSTIAVLHQLRDLGIRIALDDFGTGYSSINYLRRFPFDKIKIDRSFVSGIDQGKPGNSLVKMIAALGSSLGIPTTAEGVETEGERQSVSSAGCTQMQGYLFSHPLPARDVIQFINRFR